MEDLPVFSTNCQPFHSSNLRSTTNRNVALPSRSFTGSLPHLLLNWLPPCHHPAEVTHTKSSHWDLLTSGSISLGNSDSWKVRTSLRLFRGLVELPGLDLRRSIHLRHPGQPDSLHVCHVSSGFCRTKLACLRQLHHLHMAMLLHCYVWQQGAPRHRKPRRLPDHCRRYSHYHRVRRDAYG